MMSSVTWPWRRLRGFFATGGNWPDLAVAAIMAGLVLYASAKVISHATQEWRLVGGGGA